MLIFYYLNRIEIHHTNLYLIPLFSVICFTQTHIDSSPSPLKKKKITENSKSKNTFFRTSRLEKCMKVSQLVEIFQSKDSANLK